MLLHKIKNTSKNYFLILISLVLVLFSFEVFINARSEAVSIEDLRRQSTELEQKISGANAQAEQLAQESDSLKKKIGELDLQIESANIKIDLISNKLSQLKIELDNAQKELDRQKELLKASVVTLYKKGGASEVELLVGADSFTNYFNDQLYLEKLKSGVQESTDKVIKLKQTIQSQKAEQESLLVDQKNIKANLDTARIERTNLLVYTQGQESNYRKQVESLRQEQARILSEIVARSTVLVSSNSGGGYPDRWANAPLDAYVDDWGMYTRECVSYAAWKVHASGRNMPKWGGFAFGYEYGLRGNAKMWLENASISNIPTGSAPKAGAVAVWTFGAFGHVAYVEAVLPNGKVKISEYNVPAWSGLYSERIINAGDPSGYIYF